VRLTRSPRVVPGHATIRSESRGSPALALLPAFSALGQSNGQLFNSSVSAHPMPTYLGQRREAADSAEENDDVAVALSLACLEVRAHPPFGW
jgi:hypothetical protein